MLFAFAFKCGKTAATITNTICRTSNRSSPSLSFSSSSSSSYNTTNTTITSALLGRGDGYQGYQNYRFLSSSSDAVLKQRAKRKSKSTIAIWNKYLETGQGADNIFRSIDLSRNMSISPLELQLFVQSVESKGVSDAALDILNKLVTSDDKKEEMDQTDFQQWLNIATSPPSPPPLQIKEEEKEEESSKDGAMLSSVMKLRAKRKSKVMNLTWDRYLANPAEEAKNVFRLIDLNRNLSISSEELEIFLNSIDYRGISNPKLVQEELQKNKKKEGDDEMDFHQFMKWCFKNLKLEG